MRRLFNLDAPIVQTVAKLSNLMLLSLLWLLCCLPIVTIGASTAAFCSMTFHLRDEKASGTKDFFIAFGSNFKKATFIWLILLAGALVLVGYYYLACLVTSETLRMVLLVPFCVFFLLLSFIMLYSFPLTAYFENTVLNTLRNAFLMSIRHYRETIVSFALTMLPWLALIISVYWFVRLGFIWIVIAPGLIAYWNCGRFQKVFEQYEAE